MRPRKLDLYIWNQFVFSWAICFLFMMGIMIVFDFFANMDKFAEAAEKLKDLSIPATVAKYYLVNSLFVFLQIAPFITVTAGMFTVTRLMKHNEIVPMVVTGTSLYRILVPIFIGASIVMVLMVGLRETVLPRLRPLKERYRLAALKGEPERVKSNLFFIDLKGRLVSIDKYYSLSRKAKGLSIFSLGSLRGDWERIMAREAVWNEKEKGWELKGGKKLGPNPGGDTLIEKVFFLKGNGLDPELLEKEIKKTKEFFDFSFSELYELARLRPDYKNFKVLLHYHITFPLANILLLLLTLPLGLRFEKKSTLEGVILAIVICGLYLSLDIAMRNLGGTKVLHPVVAAWVVPIVFGSGGIALFGSIRT